MLWICGGRYIYLHLMAADVYGTGVPGGGLSQSTRQTSEAGCREDFTDTLANPESTRSYSRQGNSLKASGEGRPDKGSCARALSFKVLPTTLTKQSEYAECSSAYGRAKHGVQHRLIISSNRDSNVAHLCTSCHLKRGSPAKIRKS
jgi:hypothetical protein